MLRREGDGVTWWIRREQLEGRTGEPHRSLVLTLATRGGADEQARLGSLLLELLEDGFQEAGASAVFRGAAVTRHDFSREPFGERGLMEGLLGVLATGEVFQSNWLWTVTGTGVAEEAKPGPIGLDLYGGQFGSDIWQWQIDVGTESGSDAFLDHLAVLWADSLRVVGERTDLLWGGIYHDVYAMSEPRTSATTASCKGCRRPTGIRAATTGAIICRPVSSTGSAGSTRWRRVPPERVSRPSRSSGPAHRRDCWSPCGSR